jgi:hypothetical protein
MNKSNYELERDNFYKWIETCPLTNYRMSDSCNLSDSCTKYVIYEFHFNSVPPDIDELYGNVLTDLE